MEADTEMPRVLPRNCRLTLQTPSNSDAGGGREWRAKQLNCGMSNRLRSPSSIPILVLALVFAVSHVLLSYNSSSPISCSSSDLGVLKVYVADIPREFNYGLLESYWAARNCSKLDEYPDDPLLKQHSAEYWLLGDLVTEERSSPLVTRAWDSAQADVVFVPFFAALSAQIQLRGSEHGNFRKKKNNGDYDRQRKVVDLVKSSPEWRATGGRDHVFVLADPMAMWHVREEIANAMFLVVDFGGWYMEDAKFKLPNSSIIQHTQVSLIKDVIVPHTHLLPTLHISEDQPRQVLLYFKGARHRHRGGLIRDKLWKILEDEPNVVLEQGVPSQTGLEEATKGMRSSEFCLHPAGDTPNSCRFYDAIASLCIPVIVSDDIELPFEGFLDYTQFSIFVSTRDALQPGWLVQRLQSINRHERDAMRQRLARVQQHFEYDNGLKGGRGPVVKDGAVSLTWKKIMSKVPVIKEAAARYRRGSSPSSTRCHCVS